jgi:hypothetical protein
VLAEVNAITEEGRFEILLCPEMGDGVHTHVKKLIDNHPEDLVLVERQVPHLETAIQLLREGHGDMVAVSGKWWYENRSNDFVASIVLPRREPTRVLVSEDKPEYIPKGGIIIADCEIVRRQMIRLRKDIQVSLPQEFGEAPEDVFERTLWLEELRKEGDIDGYIIPRALHAALPFRTRRHTLGMQRENPERFRFIPVPLDGFTILISRQDFPLIGLSQITDLGAAVSLRLEMMILDNIDTEMHNKVALLIEQRKVGTILREAHRTGDDLANLGIVNDKDEIKSSKIRIDLALETVNKDGTVTAGVEKVFPPAESHSATLTVLNNWNSLLKIMRDPPEEETRGRMKELMDIYIDELVSKGRLSEDRIYSPMIKEED